MFRWYPCAHRCNILVLLGLTAWWLAGAARAADPPDTLQIGLSASLFKDVPEVLVRTTLPVAESLIAVQTGLPGKFVPVRDAEQLAEQLAGGKLQLGVFCGVEFAWARQKHAQLRPLTIAVNQQNHLQVHILVRHDCQATKLADLADKPLALPRSSHVQCQLVLQRQVCCGANALAKLKRPATAEDALDDVVDAVVQATVVDGEALESYQRRKPGRFVKLRELHKPETFPAPIVAYQPGILTDTALRTFHDGMARAHESARGRQALQLWKLSRFETVPADYEQLLADTLKTYPPPIRQDGK